MPKKCNTHAISVRTKMAATRRELLHLGSLGTIPIDALYQLFMDTDSGELLTFYQTKCSQSIGSWVYEAAACLAKYLESDHFTRSINRNDGCSPDGSSCSVRADETLQTSAAAPDPHTSALLRRYSLRGKTVVELGAGTGIVGIMAGYLGADVIITDLDGLVPLIQYNIDRNSHLLNDHTTPSHSDDKQVGRVVCQPLCWGCDPDPLVKTPDYLILANCVYYESSLEPLLQTVLELTDQQTTVLACYEERVPEIKKLIDKWHGLVSRHFSIEHIDPCLFDTKYTVSYVRLVTFKRTVT